MDFYSHKIDSFQYLYLNDHERAKKWQNLNQMNPIKTIKFHDQNILNWKFF